MAKIYDEMLLKGVRAGQIPARTQEARNWYRKTAKEYTGINEHQLMKSDAARLTNNPQFGSMYMMSYDAKHKATLPYFDRLPLIFPFKKAKGGFLGINLHYLPLQYRAILMDALYDIANNDRFDQTTKLKMNYSTLNGASKYKYFKPCIKHYLYPHLKSRFFYIYPSEWDFSIFLPLERFQGASKTKVWADSKKIIG